MKLRIYTGVFSLVVACYLGYDAIDRHGRRIKNAAEHAASVADRAELRKRIEKLEATLKN